MMIYVDTSVALAYLLAEDRRPDESFWKQSLIASRLLEYELEVRLNALNKGAAGRHAAARLIQGTALVELIPEIVERARDPFPAPVRTLDALHLASAEFLRAQGVDLHLATFDERMRTAAKKLKLPLYSL